MEHLETSGQWCGQSEEGLSGQSGRLAEGRGPRTLEPLLTPTAPLCGQESRDSESHDLTEAWGGPPGGQEGVEKPQSQHGRQEGGLQGRDAQAGALTDYCRDRR